MTCVLVLYSVTTIVGVAPVGADGVGLGDDDRGRRLVGVDGVGLELR